LLDEAFSNLDAHVKRQLRDLVRQLHERTGIPVILVTHDREDVADLCDYVVVMQRGRVVQQGSVHEVFTNPASRAVAQLVGVPNILQVRRLERAGTDAVAVTTDWGLLNLGHQGLDGAITGGTGWEVIVPREAVTVRAGTGGMAGLVESCRPRLGGRWLRLSPPDGGEHLETVMPTGGHAALSGGDEIHVTIDPTICRLVRVLADG